MTEPSGAVFLSYASQDANAARRICEALRAAGIEVWFEQNALRRGGAWDAAIRPQIKNCALLIPVISRSAPAREEVLPAVEAGGRSLTSDDHQQDFPVTGRGRGNRR